MRGAVAYPHCLWEVSVEGVYVLFLEAAMDGVVYDEQVRFFRRFECLAEELPVDNCIANKYKACFERGEPGS